ncbi:putative transcription regulator protein, MarR [Sphaerisporangium melleum]|uniref:Transcription regulator protein, MarR n=1 Tax=Sphaerisporangium melleum TaxID=321316 RepID=A0A917QY46_9ACTN|nr:MarR family transcriptional regulator [Sphaerisporangium melleum]GGK75844.1 putative transcription regulator protein, MarR [Sphaerisporangium melleum]GII72678.1 putative transcription regulator protein, MarR [Sphaerisporangium melleum]
MSHDPQMAARVWRGLRTLVLERYDRRKEVTAALDMSFIRAKALRHLAAAPMTMRQLAAVLATDAPYTTLVVDDLVRRGLVVRDVHPDDRRQKIVTATPEGEKTAEIAERILGEPPPPLLDLDPADLATLDRILATLVK